MERPEKNEIMRIEKASSLKRYWENIVQSLILGLPTLFEWITGGRKNSPTSTLRATSPRATSQIYKLAGMGNLNDGDIVVEYGPGPGPLPQHILRETREDIKYIAIELNESYAQKLRDSIKDDRLIVVNGSATEVEEILKNLGINKKVSRVLSSLPMSRDKEATKEILNASMRILSEDGALCMWNFTKTSIDMVVNAFGSENCHVTRPFLLGILKIVTAKAAEEQINQAA
jgi:phospholipid N-methyltransferase